MPRVSSKLLENRFRFALDELGLRVATNYNDKNAFVLGHAYGGVRIEKHLAGGGSADIGPRLKAPAMLDALAIVEALGREARRSSPHAEGLNPPKRVRGRGLPVTAQDREVVKTFTDKELSHMIQYTTGAAKKMFLKEAGRRAAGEYTKKYGKNPSRKSRPRPARNSAPRPELFHPPYNVQIDSERDNLNIWLSDRDDKNIAHWHDDEAREMIEDGFFSDKGGKKLADSVVEYARSMGMIK